VPAASTNLPHMDPPVPAARRRGGEGAAAAGAFRPDAPMEKILTGRLVALDDGALRAFATSRLRREILRDLFSASWCPPLPGFHAGVRRRLRQDAGALIRSWRWCW